MTVNIRYIVTNVDEALPFYTEMLGFKLEMHPAPAFAAISKDGVTVFLNQPGGGGGAGQAMPDGRLPEPGGWNRMQLGVEDIDATVTRLKAAGCHFQSDVIQGNGGKQVIVDDPSGNPIELFQPAPRT